MHPAQGHQAINILVCLDGDNPVPKIIDFGVAKALAAPLTGPDPGHRAGQLVGTPEYMSPEQAEMRKQDLDPVQTSTRWAPYFTSC